MSNPSKAKKNISLTKKKAPSTRTKGQLLVERIKGTATVRMRTDEILAITRGNK